MQFVDLTRNTPVPIPAPVPVPVTIGVPVVPPGRPTVPVAIQWLILLLILAVLGLGGVVAHDHFPRWPHPTPGPVPAPTPVVGPIRVIVLYESSDPLPAGQIDALHSTAVRAYLDEHCLKDGGLPAYRFWDKDVDASREPASWQSALSSAKSDPTPVPKVCLFTAHGMVAAPLPADETATLELLKKYGG